MNKPFSDYKHSIVKDEILETISHPAKSFDKLFATWKEHLSPVNPGADFIETKACNICASEDIRKFFSVWGFDYWRCSDCASVFLNPRPKPDFYDKTFYSSVVSELVSSDAYQNDIRDRFKRFVLPLIEPALYYPDDARLSVLEVCGRDKNLIEYLNGLKIVDSIHRYRPQVQVTGEKITELNNFDEVPAESYDLVLGILTFESIFSPSIIFKEMAKKVRRSGQIVILARAGSGFDVQLLKGATKSVFPLEHMNLISIEGYETLCRECSLSIKELSTPGVLDTKYVQRQISEVDGLDFFKYLFDKRGDEVTESFQRFLQFARLSSSLRLICSPGEEDKERP